MSEERKMSEELKVQLGELGLNEEQVTKLEVDGAVTEADLGLLSAEDIKTITDCGLTTARRIEAAFAPVVETVPAQQVALDVLPAVPDDRSFMEMVRVGGVLRIQPVDVIAAMRAAIASQVGLFDLPSRILRRMEEFAVEQDEPVDESFYNLQKLVTRRRYGDILAALDVPGNFVSAARKRLFLERLDQYLWPALRGFHEQLVAWSDAWAKGAAQPAMVLATLAMSQVGGTGPLPGMMQPPDAGPLHDQAEDVIDKINRVFAGPGIPVARAMGYDAVKTREILEDPTLPMALGAVSRDQMLKTLDVDVGAVDVRLERNIIRYALAIMEFEKVGAGTEEYSYLGALLQLGATIPWDRLGTGSMVVEEERPAEGTGFRN